MRLEPIPDVTATILHEFFVVLGNALLKTYTKQFTKVIIAFIKVGVKWISLVPNRKEIMDREKKLK